MSKFLQAKQKVRAQALADLAGWCVHVGTIICKGRFVPQRTTRANWQTLLRCK